MTRSRMFVHGARRAALVGALSLASAGAIAADLRVGLAAPPSSIDPHFNNAGVNNAIATNIFGRLFDFSADKSRLEPQLATFWQATDDKTWEFTLREGVTFSDGTPFTARDVIYSVCRIPTITDSPSSFNSQIKAIASMEAPSPHKLIIRTKNVYPILPVDLSRIAVVSARAGESEDVTFGADGCKGAKPMKSSEFGNGNLAIGTGPFKLKSFTPGDKIELVRNERYWGDKPAWDNVLFRIIPSDPARVAAFLSGDLDVIEKPPLQDIKRIEGTGGHIAKTVSQRVIYLAFDVGQEPTPGIKSTDGKNPLKDLRVRQAFTHAIDRKLIVDRIMSGQAMVAGQLLPPGFFGYDTEIKADEHDLAKAKKLLADAGYPNGFDLVLASPNDRYINDSKIAEAVAQMLTRAGIRTTVETSPFAIYQKKKNNYEYSMFLGGWGTSTGEASYTLRALVAARSKETGMGDNNQGRYDNKQLNELVEKSLVTVDSRQREAMFKTAARLVKDDVAVLPLHYEVISWAVRKGFDMTPRVDQYTLAQSVRPAK